MAQELKALRSEINITSFAFGQENKTDYSALLSIFFYAYKILVPAENDYLCSAVTIVIIDKIYKKQYLIYDIIT